jgi:S-DNA-T family DNA segregation ATPase FtsK/SpoIIIE
MKTSLATEGLVSAVFGVAAATFSGDPRWHAFTFLGTGLIALQLTKKRSKTEDLLAAAGLVGKAYSGKEETPYAIDHKIMDYGQQYVLHLPIGLSVDDFNKKKTAISNAFGGEVSFQIVAPKKICMDVITNQLHTVYPYDLCKFENDLEIPIGYSVKGFITHNFTDKRPNLLVVGMTDFGKSNFLRGAICSVINDLKGTKLHLIDLKSGIEFSVFKHCSSVDSYATSVSEAQDVVDKLVKLMKQRQQIFERAGVYKIQNYNKKFPDRKMEYHLVVVDEFASMSSEGKDNEKEIKSKFNMLLRQGRATGIHFILSTQRPTVDSISGNLKANIGAVLCFRTANRLESRISLGEESSQAAEINIQGRAIYQDFEQREVQVMLLDENQTRQLVKHTYKSKIDKQINFSGVVPC